MASFAVQNAVFRWILGNLILHYPEVQRICAGLVAIEIALGSLKEEERKKEEDEDEQEQFAWAMISVYHFRNFC